MRSVPVSHRGYTDDIAPVAATLARASKGLKRLFTRGWQAVPAIAEGATDKELARLVEDRQARTFSENQARALALRAVGI
jgi:hypothetical protein